METKRSERRVINMMLLPQREPVPDQESDGMVFAREQLIRNENPTPPTAHFPGSVGHGAPIAETGHQPHVYLIDRIPDEDLLHPKENHESWTVHADRIFRGWRLELLCCWLSMASLAVLVVFLLQYNHKPPPDWPSGITLNTVVASLSTIARTAFTVPVAEGLSQCKWNWFKKRPRPIEDFSLFDEASRGPWGSMCLLYRTKGWMIGILSALLLTSSVATSTLTQSAVKYPSRVELKGNATAWILPSFSDYEFDNRPDLEGTVLQALFSPVTAVHQLKEPHCPYSDCIWPQFQTLAICHEISNVTDRLQNDTISTIEPEVPEYDGSETIAVLPNGVYMPDKPFTDVLIAPGKPVADPVKDIQISSIFNFSVIYRDPPHRPLAADVILHWCIKTYDANVTNNVLYMDEVSSLTVVSTTHLGESNTQLGNFFLFNQSAYTYFEPTKFMVGGRETKAIQRALKYVLVTYNNAGAIRYFATGPDRLLYAMEEIKQQYEEESEQQKKKRPPKDWDDIWFTAIESMAANVGYGVVNSLLPQTPNVYGTAWSKQVDIEIRWEWLIFLAAQIVLSVIILGLVIWETYQVDVDIIKSSTIPALFAINSEEMARLEFRSRGKRTTLLEQYQFVSRGIRGQLHEIGGRWVLGSPSRDRYA